MPSRLYRHFLANLIIALVTMAWSGAPALAEGQVLNILIWPEYVNPDLVKAFEEKTNTKVKFTYFETDRDRDRILLQYTGGNFDLVLVDEINISVYRKRGWLSPITAEMMPNLKNIDERFITAMEYTSGYSVPYFWGATGIAYRSDLVDGDLETWRELLEAGPRFKAPIIMIDNAQEMVGVAMIALGHSLNESSPDLLESAAALLERQKNQVSRYAYLAVDEKSGLVTGTVSAAYIYNGDYLAIAQYTDRLKFVYPKEGGQIWIDYWAIFENSKRKELAAAFLNFMNEPKVAASNAEYLYYSTTNVPALALTSKEYRENQIIHPSAEVLARYEYPIQVSPRTLRRYNSIMQRLLE